MTKPRLYPVNEPWDRQPITPYEQPENAPVKIAGKRNSWIIAGPVIALIVISAIIVSLCLLLPRHVNALLVSPEPDPGAGHENILLVGSDTRESMGPGDGAGTLTDVPGERADTIMIASLTDERDKATLISIPRDTMVTPAEQCGISERTRINELYSVGNGRQCLVATLENVLSIHITKYVGVSMSAVKHIVDTMGGVTLCFTAPMSDNVLGEISPTEGPYQLDGRRSLKFLRARHIVGDGRSDLSRVVNQRAFMVAAWDQLAKSSNTQRAKVASLVSRSAEMDGFGPHDLSQLMDVTTILDTDNITTLTLPTIPDPTVPGALMIDEDETARVLANLSTTLKDTPRTSQRTTTYNPSDITIVVKAHPQFSDRAVELGDVLSSKGFNVELHVSDDTPIDASTTGFFTEGRVRELATVLPVLPDLAWTPMPHEWKEHDTFTLVIELGDNQVGRFAQPLPYNTQVVLPLDTPSLSMRDARVIVPKDPKNPEAEPFASAC